MSKSEEEDQLRHKDENDLPGMWEKSDLEGGWADTENSKRQPKAKVILFKPSGRYYIEEEWEIPTKDEVAQKGGRPGDSVGPYCMKYSKDFKRIGGAGSVLIETQEPWGYPHLFPTISYPERGDQFETWLKTHRDSYESKLLIEWQTVDALLDDYRLHADTRTPINEHACSGPYCEH